MRKTLTLFMFVASCSALAEALLDEHIESTAPSAINFTEQWGLAAITIPEQVSGQSLSHFAALNSPLPQQLSLTYDRTGQWLNKSHKASVWLGSLQTQQSHLNSSPVAISNANLKESVELQGFNAAFNYGRFTAETALMTDNASIINSGKFYIQGSYTVINHVSFNLAITAKLETLNQQNVNLYYGDRLQQEGSNSLLDYRANNTTLGVVGTYEVAPNWTIMGALTSTTLDDDIKQSPLIESDNLNMALIGTTYSF